MRGTRFCLAVLGVVVGAAFVMTAEARGEYRDLILTLGDVDGGVYDGAGSIDHVPVDPYWLAAVDANTPSNPERPLDWSQINQNVPFTFTFDLGPAESVVSAWLTLGLQGTAGGSAGIASDAIIFSYAPPLGPYSYDDLGWRPFSQDRVAVRSVNLSDVNGQNLIAELQDGQFNVLVRDDSMVDYAQLTLGIIPEPSTFGLLATGTLGLLTWNRRRRCGRTARRNSTRRPTGPVSVALACVLLISVGESATAAPVSPWIVNPANNHSYALLGQSDWINSEVAAIALGGHLTAINDAAEQAWVFQTFGGYGGASRLLWIGLSDADRQGQFGFSNGDALTYNHWASGEPNGGGSEDYVAMFYPGHSQQSRWNDWGHRSGDPIGVPFHGVVEITGEGQPPLFELGTDSSWLAMAPEGNREGQPIHSVGSAFEAANPGWKSDLALDTSAWSSAQPRPGGAIWGPGADTPVYLRKTFTLSDPVEDVMLLAIADDDALIYVNGTLVVSDANGLTSGLGPIDVTDYLLPGENLIAVKAHDSYGVGETLYVRLVGTVVPEPGSGMLLSCALAAGWLWRRRRHGCVGQRKIPQVPLRSAQTRQEQPLLV